ncbi:MAG: hypothetical protein U1F34_03950 [Gammaproteobacteria bacterium]
MIDGRARLFVLRLLCIWLLLSVIGVAAGKQILTPFIPLLESTTDTVMQDYSCRLSIVRESSDLRVMAALTATRPLPIAAEVGIPAGTTLNTQIDVVHQLVPLTILLVLVAAWPATNVRIWLIRCGIGLLLCPVLLMATTPIQIAGLTEIAFQEYAVKLSAMRPKPFSLYFMLFLESGGRWLMALLAAALTVSCSGARFARKPLAKRLNSVGAASPL